MGGNKRQIGAVYEDLAADYLISHGYNILERNFFSKFGEIDILAEEKGMLVAVEVKYRWDGSCGDPLEAVNFRKQRCICRTMLYYYRKKGYGLDRSCRFDVIAIYGDGTIKHIENAFEFCS